LLHLFLLLFLFLLFRFIIITIIIIIVIVVFFIIIITILLSVRYFRAMVMCSSWFVLGLDQNPMGWRPTTPSVLPGGLERELT